MTLVKQLWPATEKHFRLSAGGKAGKLELTGTKERSLRLSLR